MRELRLFLRDTVNKIMKERKFYCFCKPVNIEEVCPLKCLGHILLELYDKNMRVRCM